MTIAQIRANGGFINDRMLPDIIKENRMQLILVRCGAGRFLCPAQDASHFIEIVEKSERDYVRDVSLPAE